MRLKMTLVALLVCLGLCALALASSSSVEPAQAASGKRWCYGGIAPAGDTYNRCFKSKRMCKAVRRADHSKFHLTKTHCKRYRR